MKKVSPVAIRVPSEESLPSAPKLFVYEGARQSLERKLRTAFGGKAVVLSVTDNRSTIISHIEQSKVLYVRLHHMFLAAESSVADALVRYILDGDKDSSLVVDQYIADQGARLMRRRHAIPMETEGDYHDLSEIYDALNDRYFNNVVHSVIGWGRRTPKRNGPRKTIKLGSYSSLENVIRVNPVLDNHWVPRYFVSAVVYHEMLHHMFPSDELSSRRCLHPPEFLEREKQFRWHARALEWERKHIGRLLRS